MKGLSWLASYPKSGNTWVRALICCVLEGCREPFDINRLEGCIPSAASRPMFEAETGFESSDLLASEIEAYRAEVYRWLAKHGSGPAILKIHDALTGSDSPSVIPTEITRSAIYIVRNPFDVAISLSHITSWSIDSVIDFMEDPTATLSPVSDSPTWQLPQVLGTWSDHVRSWLDCEKFPVHLVRYEDLHADPEGTFRVLLEHIHLPVGSEDLKRAIRYSAFGALREQERHRGFNMNPWSGSRFFRSGQVGQGRRKLSIAQKQRLVDAHSIVMQTLGYSVSCSRRSSR